MQKILLKIKDGPGETFKVQRYKQNQFHSHNFSTKTTKEGKTVSPEIKKKLE
jgi:hypothetical protein